MAVRLNKHKQTKLSTKTLKEQLDNGHGGMVANAVYSDAFREFLSTGVLKRAAARGKLTAYFTKLIRKYEAREAESEAAWRRFVAHLLALRAEEEAEDLKKTTGYTTDNYSVEDLFFTFVKKLSVEAFNLLWPVLRPAYVTHTATQATKALTTNSETVTLTTKAGQKIAVIRDDKGAGQATEIHVSEALSGLNATIESALPQQSPAEVARKIAKSRNITETDASPAIQADLTNRIASGLLPSIALSRKFMDARLSKPSTPEAYEALVNNAKKGVVTNDIRNLAKVLETLIFKPHSAEEISKNPAAFSFSSPTPSPGSKEKKEEETPALRLAVK